MNTDLISRSSLKKKIHSFMSGPECMQALLNEPAVIGPEWFSVDDRLPEDMLADKDTKIIHCLVALAPPRSQPGRKPLVTKAQRQWNSWTKSWEWGRVSGVTHWMPLIEPPDMLPAAGRSRAWLGGEYEAGR